jgi:SH3-like domain-containing protein
MITFLLTLSLALAQNVGDFRFTTTEVKLLRYPDAVEISATVKKGTKVEVVAEGDTLIRVRSGRDFGWMHSVLLSEDEPAAQ